jgi:hypothetical protein
MSDEHCGQKTSLLICDGLNHHTTLATSPEERINGHERGTLS